MAYNLAVASWPEPIQIPLKAPFESAEELKARIRGVTPIFQRQQQ
jgi:hypothetical protein